MIELVRDEWDTVTLVVFNGCIPYTAEIVLFLVQSVCMLPCIKVIKMYFMKKI